MEATEDYKNAQIYKCVLISGAKWMLEDDCQIWFSLSDK